MDVKEEKIKPGDKSETDEYKYKRDHLKSLKQIAKETDERVKKQAQVPDKPEEKKEEVKTPIPPEGKEEVEAKTKADKEASEKEAQAKKLKDEQEARDKAIAEEAAKKVAEETKGAFKEEISKILDKDKTLEEKQKEADSLIATWTKENRLPKNYEELIAETMRIAETKMEQRLKEREAAQKAEQEAKSKQEQEEKAKTETEAKKAQDKGLEDFNKATSVDLEDLYVGKFLTRPLKPEEINNEQTTDAGAKETQEIFKFWADLNIERTKQNLSPIVSLNKLYFMHYKPFKDTKGKQDQPPGDKAPISGGRNTPTGGESKKAFIYARDHGKSWGQWAAEAKSRAKQGV